MLRQILILTAVVLVFSACELQAAVIHSTWVGGEQGDWGQASNWSPNTVPDNSSWQTYAVTIGAGSGEVSVGFQQNRTISKLDCYGGILLHMSSLEQLRFTLLDANGLTNYGELQVWEINICGNVTNTAGAYLGFYNLEIVGNLYNQAGAMLEICDEEVSLKSETTGSGNLENSGTIFIGTNGGLNVHEGKFNNLGEILIYGGGIGADEEILDNNDTGLIKGFGVVHSGQLLRNKGRIVAFAGSLVVACEGAITNTGLLRNEPLASLQINPSLFTEPVADVNNFGTIEVNAGGVAFDCNLVNEPNGIIKLLGGTLAATSITQTADANFVGFGGITGDVVIAPNGIIKLAGPTNIVGDVEIDENGTLEISDGSTLITGSTTNNGVIHVVNGNVVFQGGYSGNGVVNK